MNDDSSRRNSSGRVADYFVVVGANSRELLPLREDDPLNANDPVKQSRPLEMVFETEIVSRYPLVDPENTPSFPDGLTLFCLPDGLRVSQNSKPPSFFSFVQTSDKGSRLVGSCLTFYEKLNQTQRANFLKLCHESPETMLLHPDVDSMRLYVPRCLCVISEWPFVESFRKFLCHVYRLSLTPSSIPIERFICNFIDDVPVPPSGKVAVSYLLPGCGAGEDSSFVFTRPPINEPNAWNSLPMKSLFECLSVANILAVFTAVLTERTVVFISSQNHLLASAAETIISLMYPLQWSHVYIPILPRCLLGVLSAPVPLIIGLNSAFLPAQEDQLDPPKSDASLGTPPFDFSGLDKSSLGEGVTDRGISSSSSSLDMSVSSAPSRTATVDSSASDSSADTTSAATSATTSAAASSSSSINLPQSPAASISSTFVNTGERFTEGVCQPSFVDDRYYAVFPPETVQVYLDENRINFGSLGPPPRLPERRRKKLYADLVALVGTQCFDERPADWATTVQPYYDSAYKMSLRPDMVDGTDQDSAEIDEKAIRGIFLKFFVSVLQSYRKYLVYPSKACPFPLSRFREADFLAGSPADWREFLVPLLESQAFHQFVDARLSRSGWTDPEIIFFDESIDAKINRYTFRLHRHDTPFLTNESNKHTKTFVAPTVDMHGLEDLDLAAEVEDGNGVGSGRGGSKPFSFVYPDGFPELKAHLFGKKRHDSQSNAKLFGISDGDSSQRLKRVSALRLPFRRKSNDSISAEEAANRAREEDGHVSGGGYSPACVFSTFLTLWGSFISSGLSEPKVVRAPPTLSEVLGRHLNITVGKRDEGGVEGAGAGDSLGESGEKDFTLLSKSPHKSPHKSSRKSVSRVSSCPGSATDSGPTEASAASFARFDADLRDEYLTITRSAIKIAFELFHVMNLRGFAVDANVYRTLANSCAVCGAGDRAIDLLQVMLAHKMLPDRTICASIASAISFSMGDVQKVDSSPDGSEDLLLVAPKDVYEAAVNNNVKSLLKHLPCRGEEEEREETLLAEDMNHHHYHSQHSTSRSKSKSRFSLFSRGGSPDCTTSSTRSHSTSNCSQTETEGDLLTTVGAASPRFSSQILLAERTLDFLFPELEIDVCHPYGTTCPNSKCSRSLLMSELMENYAAFDPNAYTVTCPYCSKSFVPRFTVLSSKEGWVGSEGPGSLLWCELLSPWVLQKEVMSIINEHGIKKIVSQEFKTGSCTPQYAVLFWNLIVSFRLYGLPYAFLICEKPSLAFLIPLD